MSLIRFTSKLTAVALLVSTVLSAGVPALAREAPVRTNATAQTERMSNLRERGLFEIERRVTSLEELSARVFELGRLTDSQKATLTDRITTEINSLNSLAAKIEADTDLETLKADVKSVVDSYRVYALMMPQIRLLAANAVAAETAAKLTTLMQKLQIRLDAADAAGQDVAGLQLIMEDMKAKLNTAASLYSEINTILLSLTPDGYPGNRTSLQMARTKLREEQAALKAAAQDARQIAAGLKRAP